VIGVFVQVNYGVGMDRLNMLRKTTLWKITFIGLQLLFCIGRVDSVSAGINIRTGNGLEGGEIYTLAIDPSVPSNLYAESWGGGVFVNQQLVPK
jgi:hypothetical protein